MIEKIRQRIAAAAKEACGYAPLTRVISEAEVKEILEQEEKPQTNADRIRSMTDDELAEFLKEVKEDYQWANPDYPDCEDCGEWLNWLQSEAETEESDGI